MNTRLHCRYDIFLAIKKFLKRWDERDEESSSLFLVSQLPLPREEVLKSWYTVIAQIAPNIPDSLCTHGFLFEAGGERKFHSTISAVSPIHKNYSSD